jgi:O-acetyl-ADP-ribose deacetylase (regulator of RNase III)
MGAGIAKEIKEVFPSAYAADKKTIVGDKNKLGTFTFSKSVINNHEIIVVNAYTQFNWEGEGKKVDYPSIEKSFTRIKEQFSAKRIGYPLIGAGLGGGDWKIISKIIDLALSGENHTLIKYHKYISK